MSPGASRSSSFVAYEIQAGTPLDAIQSSRYIEGHATVHVPNSRGAELEAEVRRFSLKPT